MQQVLGIEIYSDFQVPLVYVDKATSKHKWALAHDLVVSIYAEVYIYPHPLLVRRILQKLLYEMKVLCIIPP